MGLAELFNRSTVYTATNTETGVHETWTVVDNLAPDWSYGGYQGGMSIPGASRAALLLADLLGAVPWSAYREKAGSHGEKVSPIPPLLDQPAPPETRVATLTSLALDLLWHGNAVAVIATRDAAGVPTSLLPVPAEYVQVRRVGMPDAEIGVPRGAVVYEIGRRRFSSDDVMHIKGPSRPGALRGMGVLENHLNTTLRLSAEQQKQAASLPAQGVPTGLLRIEDTPEDPMDETEAAEVKAGWLRAQQNRTVAVLNSRTTFEPLAWNPSETQLLDARKFSLHEIALIFGLDPAWLGAPTTSQVYQNVEQKGLDLLKYSLNGHLARFEQAFSQLLPAGMWAEANLDALLRADTLTRYQAHAIALDKGFLTLDEVRELERRPPLTPAQREAARPLAPPAAPAGQDPAVGAEEGTRSERDLLKYWVRGPGLAKWASSPQPLLALYNHLKKYLPPDRAKWTALAWFPLGMGRNPVTADGDLPDFPGEEGEG